MKLDANTISKQGVQLFRAPSGAARGRRPDRADGRSLR
jgi:hypothetical protein